MLSSAGRFLMPRHSIIWRIIWRIWRVIIWRVAVLAGAALSLTCGQLLHLPEREAAPNYDCSVPGCACVAGFADCDGDLANGCEVKLAALANDPLHCGGCDNACASGVCLGGQCGCASKSWPMAAPGMADGAAKLDLVFALRSLTMIDPGGKPVGFDLDEQCTGCACPQAPSKDVCIQGRGKNIDDKTADGIDNAAAGVMPLALAATGDQGGIDALSSDAGKGEWSLLVRVRDYNGEPNDPEVRVAVYAARAFSGDPCNPGGAPQWKGDDRWPVRSDSLKGTPTAGAPKSCGDSLGQSFDAPRFEDAHAFVSGGVLTATWPDEVAFYLAGSSQALRIELHQAAVTATLDHDATGHWHLGGGVVGGGWPERAVFRSLGAVRIGGKPLCTDDAAYPALKDLLCGSEDVRTDKGGPTSLCDAISFAFSFEGKAARLGSVVVPEALGPPCPAPIDPSNDSCTN